MKGKRKNNDQFGVFNRWRKKGKRYFLRKIFNESDKISKIKEVESKESRAANIKRKKTASFVTRVGL